MKAFNNFFSIVILCVFGVLLQSCLKDKTLKNKKFEDIRVNISPSYGVPLVNLKITGEDVVRRINRDSATRSFFVEYDKNDYDLCIIVYDKTIIPVMFPPDFTVFDTFIEYPLDFFGDLRKDGWIPMTAQAMLYVDNSYTTSFNLNLKKLDYNDLYGISKSVVTAGSVPKTGIVEAATTSGAFKRTLTIDKLVADDPFDLVFKGRDAILSFELTSANPPGDKGRLNLNPILKIPAHLIMDNFVRRDTVSVSLNEILKHDAVSIDTITFYLKMINAQPLDAKVQVYFVDANYHVLDSLREKEFFVEAGITNPSTYLVQTPTITIKEEEAISMTKEKLQKVQNTRFLIIKETFTSNGKDAKLFKSNYIDVILSAKVDAKIKGYVSEIRKDISTPEN